MVNGIEAFRDYFAEYTDQYVIIGGFACDLLMEDAGLDFRQTKDIDMVIIIEALTERFAARFWSYIKAGGYKPYVGSHGESEFYRSVEPTGSDYPFMIELFSRPQNNVRLRPDTHLMPLHIDDTISSLSAILLNEDYYKFLLSGRTEVDHIPVLNAEHIVPFLMKAWRCFLKSLELTCTPFSFCLLKSSQAFILNGTICSALRTGICSTSVRPFKRNL